jgi:hypothetical protein
MDMTMGLYKFLDQLDWTDDTPTGGRLSAVSSQLYFTTMTD